MLIEIVSVAWLSLRSYALMPSLLEIPWRYKVEQKERSKKVGAETEEEMSADRKR